MPQTKAIRTSPFMSPRVERAVHTRADTESLMSGSASKEKWQALIDRTLILWLDDPSLVADDGIEAPTGTTLRLALDYAESFRDQGRAPADAIVPDANGGIILRRHA